MLNNRDAAKQLRAGTPSIRAIEIARILGISKARIRAILISEGLPTKIKIDYKKYMCLQCNTRSKYSLCSEQCRQQYYYITIKCYNCDAPIILYKKLYKRKLQRGEKTFCSRSCRHKWLWKHDMLKKRREREP